MSKAKPILNSKHESLLGGMISVAHSCPAFGIPPQPPSRRPLKPKVQPPSLLLPSSPMFETEISRKSSETEKTELSRSLSEYGGFSCPQNLPSGFLDRLTNGAKQSKVIPASTSQGTSQDTRGLGDVKLSSSPTVFELLKRRVISDGPSLGQHNSGSRSNNSTMGQYSSQQDDLSDMLQFDLTLDAGGSDGKETTLPSHLT
mmetsp:Transcript_4492/g.5965  ORF Transcript_4492/g.5965 Transcript_4492/m.5965 type:complete len:201 (-) Transcript_4492:431-1033(-)